jgi:ubiquinone/menaquinone biosynthesis C-methylase UbiE
MTARDYWDSQADVFDAEPDHGLLDPDVRAAWRNLLLPLLPAAPATVADIGCGTGTLSVLLADAGHELHGLDLSDRMVAHARAKAKRAGVSARFDQGDAERPPFPAGSFDAVLVRHVLWALPDPDAALLAWIRLLKPQGCLILVEGRWGTGAGLSAADCSAAVLRHRKSATVTPLPEAAYWGREIDDERYLLISPR